MLRHAYKYGVEIECLINSYTKPISSFIDMMQGLGVDVGEDGSIKTITSNYQGLELRTPPLNLKNTCDLLEKVGEISREFRIEVNDSCGLHVHTSNPKFFENINLRKILGLWVAMEDVFFATQPESRLNSNYCKRRLASYAVAGFPKLPAEKAKLVSTMGASDRYFALNFASLRQHGTIECRLHAGTINATKITNWIKLLTAFYNYALYSYDATKVNKLFLMPTSEEKIVKAWDLLKLDSSLKSFYNQRVEKFMLSKLNKQQDKAKEMISYRIKTAKEETNVRKMINKAYNMQDSIRAKMNKMIKKSDEKSNQMLKEANGKSTVMSQIKTKLVKEFVDGNPTLTIDRIMSPWGNVESNNFLLGETRNSNIRGIATPEYQTPQEPQVTTRSGITTSVFENILNTSTEPSDPFWDTNVPNPVMSATEFMIDRVSEQSINVEGPTEQHPRTTNHNPETCNDCQASRQRIRPTEASY